MLVILVVPIVSDCLLMMSWALGMLVIVVVIGLVMVIVVVNAGRVICW